MEARYQPLAQLMTRTILLAHPVTFKGPCLLSQLSNPSSVFSCSYLASGASWEHHLLPGSQVRPITQFSIWWWLHSWTICQYAALSHSIHVWLGVLCPIPTWDTFCGKDVCSSSMSCVASVQGRKWMILYKLTALRYLRRWLVGKVLSLQSWISSTHVKSRCSGTHCNHSTGGVETGGWLELTDHPSLLSQPASASMKDQASKVKMERDRRFSRLPLASTHKLTYACTYVHTRMYTYHWIPSTTCPQNDLSTCSVFFFPGISDKNLNSHSFFLESEQSKNWW